MVYEGFASLKVILFDASVLGSEVNVDVFWPGVLPNLTAQTI